MKGSLHRRLSFQADKKGKIVFKKNKYFAHGHKVIKKFCIQEQFAQDL